MKGYENTSGKLTIRKASFYITDNCDSSKFQFQILLPPIPFHLPLTPRKTNEVNPLLCPNKAGSLVTIGIFQNF